MPAYWLESSAAAKLYVNETGSRWLRGLVAPPRVDEFFLVQITVVEVAAALLRRARGGSLTRWQAESAVRALRGDQRTVFQIVDVTDALISAAIDVALKHGLCSYDCVQLAAALRAEHVRRRTGRSPLILVSADLELNRAARAEGLAVDDPNAHP